MRPLVPLAFLMILFAGWCVAFNIKTPYRTPGVLINQRNEQRLPLQVSDVGAPDERQHANYVAHILAGKGFPVLIKGDGEGYESHQPPLYYLLSAGWCKLLGADPEQSDAGFRLRLLNTLIGLGTMAGLFCAVRWGLGRDDIALGAAAFMLLPMLVGLHSSASNDPLLYLLCTWAVAFAIRGAANGWNMKWAILCGVMAGLALLTKTTGLALFPVLMVAMLVGKRAKLLTMVVALAVPLLIASPWLLRNQSLYGDPFALKAFSDAFQNSPKASMFIEGGGAFAYWTQMVGWWTARSFVGVFGYMDIFLFQNVGTTIPFRADSTMSDLFYRLIMAVFVVLSGGWLLGLRPLCDWATKHELPNPKPFNLICGALLAVVVLLFVQFNLTYFQGQARYLFPALVPLGAGFAIGLSRWMGKKANWAWAVMAVFLVVLDIVSFLAISDGFALRTSI